MSPRLTIEERDALTALALPLTSRALPAAIAGRLIALGLAKPVLGGFTVTDEGHLELIVPQ